MNATLEMMSRRRSVAPLALAAPGPDATQLEALLTIAARTPDHGKLAPWRFLVFEAAGAARAGAIIAEIFRADHPLASADQVSVEERRLSLAPVVVGVISRAAPHVKIPEWEQVLSAGAVCQNLVVGANAMGFGVSWLTQWYAYDRRVLDALGLAPHEKMAGFVHIGTSASNPEDRTRPELADLVSRFEG